MRSFTKSHLERAARLAILSRLAKPTLDPERIVLDVVRLVAEEGEPVYPRWTVLQLAARAAVIYHEQEPMIQPLEAAEEALRELESA